jgi:hypothetical protein
MDCACYSEHSELCPLLLDGDGECVSDQRVRGVRGHANRFGECGRGLRGVEVESMVVLLVRD